MEIIGTEIPLWALFIIGIIGIVLIWKLIKFAIKILIIVIIFFVILIGLDLFHVFDAIKNIFIGVI